ncbi:MAG: universal stress protein [Nitrospirota bacterium]|jgi:nucleotide-binding universal stress UspA family protein
MKKILVAHDGSKLSDKALKRAVEIAVAMSSSLTVLSVIPELYLTELSDIDRGRIVEALTEETKTAMEKVRISLASKPVEAKTIIRQGPAAEKILETAQKMKVDLLVVGSHGRHGARKFLLGSVSSKVVDHATCPVLVVK